MIRMSKALALRATAPPMRPTPDQAQRGAPDVLAQEHVYRPAAELPRPHEAITLGEAAGRSHHQRECEVGSGVSQHARCVGGHHAVACGGIEVDVVEADCDVGDDLEPGGRENCTAERVHDLAEDALASVSLDCAPDGLFGQ